MKKQIYDEKNGLWYELRGDYYYPLLTFPEEEYRPVGVWGQRHGRYLREHKRAVYTALLTSGKLNSYLAEIDQQTQDMFLQLVEQMAEREGVTEKLKAEDQMRWVGLMNNIAERAREIVNAEIIYSGTSAINVPTHTEYKEPPKIFWKYYDLYRRKKISLHEYAIATGLSAFVIRHYLHDVVENSPKIIENPKQI